MLLPLIYLTRLLGNHICHTLCEILIIYTYTVSYHHLHYNHINCHPLGVHCGLQNENQGQFALPIKDGVQTCPYLQYLIFK